ncbi:MAG: NAD-dependent epimerase, partial [Nitrospiraceae bacterium]
IDWAIGRSQDTGSFVAVNAGCDEWNYQVRELADAVAEVVGNVRVSIASNAQPDKRSYKVSFRKFRQLAPDHQPRVTLQAAIAELIRGLA